MSYVYDIGARMSQLYDIASKARRDGRGWTHPEGGCIWVTTRRCCPEIPAIGAGRRASVLWLRCPEVDTGARGLHTRFQPPQEIRAPELAAAYVNGGRRDSVNARSPDSCADPKPISSRRRYTVAAMNNTITATITILLLAGTAVPALSFSAKYQQRSWDRQVGITPAGSSIPNRPRTDTNDYGVRYRDGTRALGCRPVAAYVRTPDGRRMDCGQRLQVVTPRRLRGRRREPPPPRPRRRSCSGC